MNKILIAISLLATLLLQSWQYPAKKSNPYGLDLVSDRVSYDRQVKENPANRLVDLEKSIDRLVLDIRYATTNNFTGVALYPEARAFARQPVADALRKVQKELKRKGIGLKIFDAYRPYAVTLRFFEVYPDTNFVASPRKGSRHNRGCAVDLTLIDLTSGKELEMPTPFDDFSGKASHSYQLLSDSALRNRKLLRDTMEHYGFEAYSAEWWHYDFSGWRSFSLMDLSFDELLNTQE